MVVAGFLTIAERKELNLRVGTSMIAPISTFILLLFLIFF